MQGGDGSVLIWVPTEPVADALAGLDGVTVEVVSPAGADLPASAARVEFYVPPFFPPPDAVTAMASMPALRVVQTLTAGFDRVRPHVPAGAVLCNARGAHDASTAEWVVGAAVAVFRQFPYFAVEQAAGRWSYRFTDTLAGKRVLIVGYGSIGQALERRLAGFDVEVRRVARSARHGVSPPLDLPELLPDADVVILLAPVTRETAGMVDAAFLARMKDGALLINAARGVLVVTDDLVEELRTGRLFAAVDVTDPEPLPADHPLWSLPNVLITPHIGASNPYSLRMANKLVRAQAERYLAGQPLANVITGEY
ncbi:MAG TPA: 2-hydroxyacid dehydrogenase [Streptosporangiaceae bacterium]|nr:2-hydroxyacid dehydrogenase [Streptosporangiaceae bacterium]